MLFNRGKTYLAIVDDDEWSNFSYGNEGTA